MWCRGGEPLLHGPFSQWGWSRTRNLQCGSIEMDEPRCQRCLLQRKRRRCGNQRWKLRQRSCVYRILVFCRKPMWRCQLFPWQQFWIPNQSSGRSEWNDRRLWWIQLRLRLRPIFLRITSRGIGCHAWNGRLRLLWSGCRRRIYGWGHDDGPWLRQCLLITSLRWLGSTIHRLYRGDRYRSSCFSG